MTKFNWNRFYDELEQGDPQKFPYWMFFMYSIGDIVEKIISGIFLGFVILIIIISSLGIWTKYLEANPDIPINAFCTSYGIQKDN